MGHASGAGTKHTQRRVKKLGGDRRWHRGTCP